MTTDNKNAPITDEAENATDNSAPEADFSAAAAIEPAEQAPLKVNVLPTLSEEATTSEEAAPSKNSKQGAQVNDTPSSRTAQANTQTDADPSGNVKISPVGKKRKIIIILVVLLVLSSVITVGSSYLGYFVWQAYEKDNLANSQAFESLNQAIADLTKSNRTLLGEQKNSAENSRQIAAALQARLQAAEQRLLAQNKRLQSMSTTSREDWLLAEAEYLLKLANQRVLVERSAESAVALLEEADGILRDMVDPDLFPLRQAIANDLAALRLTKSIDVEGIYLGLQALAGQVDNIPVRYTPVSDTDDKPQSSQVAEAIDGSETTVSWWQKPLKSFNRFAFSLNEHVRIKDHGTSERPVVFVTPDTAIYLQQNLTMQIERAQLALLREQQKIYGESLLQAAHWVAKYFPDTSEAQIFRSELQRLAGRNVVKTLPDISGSLELLNTYIEQLHDLQGATPKKGSAQ